MYLSKSDIENTSKIKRLNIINSVTGIKPANLIGTRSDSGIPNLAIISSVVHLGSDPALIGFIMRPKQEVRRDTFQNIMDTGFFTINHIHSHFIENAHYTSAKFDKEVSEFDQCGLTEECLNGFKAPYVKQSQLKIGLKHVENLPININKTIMIIGQIEHLYLPDYSLDKNGYIDLGKIDNVGISGLNSYYSLKKITDFPYAYLDELPDFKNEETAPAL